MNELKHRKQLKASFEIITWSPWGRAHPTRLAYAFVTFLPRGYSPNGDYFLDKATGAFKFAGIAKYDWPKHGKELITFVRAKHDAPAVMVVESLKTGKPLFRAQFNCMRPPRH